MIGKADGCDLEREGLFVVIVISMQDGVAVGLGLVCL